MYFGESPGIQVVIFVASSLAQVIYLELYRPFEDPFKNRVEILNEATVLLVSSWVSIFCCDDEEGEDQRQVSGWLILALILSQCIMNFLIQAWQIVK